MYSGVPCINDFLLGIYTWTFMHSVQTIRLQVEYVLSLFSVVHCTVQNLLTLLGKEEINKCASNSLPNSSPVPLWPNLRSRLEDLVIPPTEAQFKVRFGMLNSQIWEYIHESQNVSQIQNYSVDRSRGRAWHMPCLPDPKLSFSHTFSPKSTHIGG